MSVLSGCVAPDQWRVFNSDYARAVTEALDREAVPPSTIESRAGLVASEGEGVVDGTVRALSIERAVMMVFRNNGDLRVESYNPVIAGTFERIERGRYDTELFAEFSNAEERVTETARSTGEQFSVEGTDYAFASGIRQVLPTGTEIELSVEQERSISSRTPEQQSARVGLSVTQSLLQGFGLVVGMAEIRQAELNTLASLFELRWFAQVLLAEVETAYWQYVLSIEEITIFEESLVIAERQRDETEERIAVGDLLSNEAAAVRAEVALRQKAVINAHALLEDSRLRLARLINPFRDARLDFEIEAVSPLQIEPLPIDNLGDRLRLAEQSRPDLNEAHLRLERDGLETIVTRNGLLPRLEFFFNFGQTGFSDSITGSFNEIGGDTYDITAGVVFSHTLRNREAKARDTRARASYQQAEAAIENLRQLIMLDVRIAANEVERTRQQIHATAATRAFQVQTVSGEEERYSVGAATALDVARVRRDLLAARIAEVESVVRYRLALVGLYLAEGSLLERRGIVIKGI
jgi:outer membrane protein TolC